MRSILAVPVQSVFRPMRRQGDQPTGGHAHAVESHMAVTPFMFGLRRVCHLRNDAWGWCLSTIKSFCTTVKYAYISARGDASRITLARSHSSARTG